MLQPIGRLCAQLMDGREYFSLASRHCISVREFLFFVALSDVFTQTYFFKKEIDAIPRI